MYLLGISAYYHDSAAALIRDGEVVAAAQEERFSRVKHDPRFPSLAIKACLDQASLKLSEVDRVVFFERPYRKFGRLVSTYLAGGDEGWRTFEPAMKAWLGGKLFQKATIQGLLRDMDPDWRGPLLFSEHHLSHAASAFYPSPFEEAVVLTVDGVGEWASSSVCFGHGAALDVKKDLHFPHSLGLLYAAFTSFTGFKVNSGEYKIMGLAPYGEPVYAQRILDKLVDVKADGSIRIEQSYFDYMTGFEMTNDRFAALFDGPARSPETPLTQREMNIAASIQVVTEEIMVKMVRGLALEFDCANLALAGGVALNCVANGKILRDGKFRNLWIQPAAGDAGGALGAALYAYYAERPSRRVEPLDAMKGAYLGPSFSNEEIGAALTRVGARFERLPAQAVVSTAARALADQKAVGWFDGRMEFGPRSLGARSILADARSPVMQRVLNLKVKYRESFRPFAPAVLAEDVQDWFELDRPSPYMLLVADVRPELRRPMTDEQASLFGIDKLNIVRSSIPAVTHVDYSARVQTVHAETNPRFHALLSEFKALTGAGVLVNTSFNVRGEPIVCTPEDAFRCFMGTELDLLVLEDHVLWKENQDPSLKLDYSNAFELD
jgi:carbamoyltransferase